MFEVDVAKLATKMAGAAFIGSVIGGAILALVLKFVGP
jgi:hypothetical protein